VSARAPREPPHRVAFLESTFVLAPVDEPLRGAAKVLLFITLFQHLVRHPDLAIIDPDDAQLVFDGGEPLLLAQRHTPEVRRDLFANDRRDELLWLELGLAKTSARVVLRTLSHDGREESFVALGNQSLGAMISRCLEQWLSARDLVPAPHELECFDVATFLGVCKALRSSTGVNGGESPTLVTSADSPSTEGPARLAVPFLRTLAFTSGRDFHELILGLDPDDPWALRDRFFASLQAGRDFSILRRLLALAPGWGKPYLSWHRSPGATTTRSADDGLEVEDDIHAFAAATLRMSGNHWALANYASSLDEAGRLPEALRYRIRALRASGYGSAQYPSLLWTAERLGRRGAQLRSSVAWMRDLEGRLEPASREENPDLLRARLSVADAYMAVGRHAEAVLMRESVLRGNESLWPNQAEKLDRWRKDPGQLARSYAREGHFRGDPGRVIEGLSAVSPHGTGGFDARALMRAFVAVGKPELACFAWAHLQAQPDTQFPTARLEAARALLVMGDLERATHEMLGVALAHPQRGYETTTNRLLRLSVAVGAEAWATLVSKHLARGARSVARLLARDAADFVPGAGEHESITDALGGGTCVQFDGGWLEPLRAHTNADCSARIDAFFSATIDSLADADSLVNAWTYEAHLLAEAGADAAGELAYLATQAIARYLAATTGPPTPSAGALRTVADEALQACSRVASRLDDRVVKAVLTVLENAAVCDEWTLDTWLLRVERALSIEDRWNGHLEVPTAGLPRVASLLRGDERVASEYRTAHELRRTRADGWGTLAHRLFERTMRAGAEPSHEWSDAAACGLSVDDALDVHWTCIAATRGHATPSVNAAKVLLVVGRTSDAFEALCGGVGLAGKDWRTTQLTELTGAWETAQVDVPIDWKRCNAEGAVALQTGDLPRAIKCLRWCATLEPDNRELWRNLGIAYAQNGDAYEAIRAFARFDDATEGVKLAGLVLCQAKHARDGLAVLEYVARWFTRAEDHRYHGLFAWRAGDDAAMARAYGRAWGVDPAALTGTDLDGYAGLLYELGDYAGCERVTERLEAVAGSDAELQGCVWHRRACADMGFDRWDDAVLHAKKAVEINPSTARKAYCEETLALALGRRKAPVTVLERDTAAPMFDAFIAGDFRGILALGESTDWWLRHAALVASEFRYDSENEIPVTARASRVFARVLELSLGAVDVVAALARTEALRMREDKLFSLDPPPPLGDRLTRDGFRRELAMRSGLPLLAPVEKTTDLAPEPDLAAGAPVTRASDYADLLRALRGSDPAGALASRGLDLNAYERVCRAWTLAMDEDANLVTAVRARMASP